MSLLFKCININKRYGDRVILKDINFEIQLGEKVAIVGDNGAGKTTLANILLNNIQPDEGQIIWHSHNYSKGYLKQAIVYNSKEFEQISKSDSLKNYLYTTKQLGINKVYDFCENRLNSLSGGEQRKLAIASVWAKKPQLLILDEPTNHLDYLGINWLIKEIKNYQGTIIIISHDRYFIDQCVSKTIEIERGTAQLYKGNYSYYRKLKQKKYNDQLQKFKEQEKHKQSINEEINQLRQWSAKAHSQSTKKDGLKEYFRVKAKKKDKQIKSKIKKLQKINLTGLAKPNAEQAIKFKITSHNVGGERVLEAQNIAVNYANTIIFSNSSFYIKRAEKVALFGANGCGKTTLIKAILKSRQLNQGKLYLSSSAKVAYLSQDDLTLNENQTILDYFETSNFKQQALVQTTLANLGFTKEMVCKQIQTLSLGEKTRIKIAKMILQNNSVLILDEPTNHLDLHSREMLEKTLKDYKGTLIVVSHDRYFLNKICDKVLVFENKNIKRYEYSFAQYIQLQEKQHKNELQNYAHEQLMIINNRLAIIVSEFNGLELSSEAYKQLDKEYLELTKLKHQLIKLGKQK